MGKRLTSIVVLAIVGPATACSPSSPHWSTTDGADAEFVYADSSRRLIRDLIESANLAFTLDERSVASPFGRVTATARLRDGQVLVIDGLANEVLLFTPGQGTSVLARKGAGPGEVLLPTVLQRLAGDSVQLYDRRLGRVSVRDPRGQLAYEVSLLGSGARLPVWVGRIADTLLIGLIPNYTARTILAGTRSANLGVVPLTVVLYRMNGAVADTVGEVPGFTDVRSGRSSMSSPFGTATPFAITASGQLVSGTGRDPSFRILGLDGAVQRIYRLDWPRRPMHRDSILRRLLAAAPSPRARRSVRALPMLAPELLPDSQPSYQVIRTFGGDQIWLGSAELFGMPSRTWQVVGPDGQWLATIELPPKTALLDVAYGHAVLLRKNELDVQRIEVYDVGGVLPFASLN